MYEEIHMNHFKPNPALQVKGHLDYMRQMDTILVAVGVPTKEVPGASFAVLQPPIKKRTVNIPDQQTTQEQQVTEAENPAQDGVTHTEESRDGKEGAETEEMGDGWDIPDISDLLDSLHDAESDSQTAIQNNFSLTAEENATGNATESGYNARYDVKDTDLDNEHISWSWDDTSWAAEHSHQ